MPDARPGEPAPAEPAAARPRFWLHHPAIYVVLAALYVASFQGGWLPEPERQPPGDAVVVTGSQSLEDVLQHPQDLSFGVAALLLVPFMVGSALLIGYVMLRACNVRAFPRCEFRAVPWSGWHLARCGVAFLVAQRLVMAGMAWLEAAPWAEAVLPRLPRVVVLAAGANAMMIVTCLFVIALVANEPGGPLIWLGLRENRVLSRAAIGLTGMAMVVPLLLVAGVIMWVCGPLFGIEPRPQQLLLSARHIGPAGFAILGFSAVVVAPVTEEILFRGFLYATIRRYVGPLGAISLTALGFSLLHNYAFGFLSLFLIGFLLGYLYERTGSLAASIAAHAANNLYSLLIVFVVFHSSG